MCPRAMAVRADDIALGYFCQDPVLSRTADHSCDSGYLARRLAMIEVHSARCEPSAAIGARNAAQVVEELTLGAPVVSLAVQVARRPLAALCLFKPPTMLIARTYSVADRTYDIALGDFCEEPSARCAHCRATCQPEGLERWLPMIEVHLIGSERLSAVGSRSRVRLLAWRARTRAISRTRFRP